MVTKTVTSASGTRAPRATLISVGQAKALRRIIRRAKRRPIQDSRTPYFIFSIAANKSIPRRPLSRQPLAPTSIA